MIYSSVTFLFYFLPLLLVIYYLLPGTRLKNVFLLLGSLAFYAFGAGKLLILLLIVGLCAWLFSLLIAKTKFKKGFLVVAIIIYIAILIYYKYLGFIIDNLIYAGIKGLPEVRQVVTIGLSFFIFQAISYNIDVYRKNNVCEKNPGIVVLYITMFPQLISGPLVRFRDIRTHILSRSFDPVMFTEGVRRFIIGLAKKVLIANPLSLVVEKVAICDQALLSPGVAWTGLAAFTLQIFFDFSGYTDMAIGVGKMLGFNLPENFNYPYISRSITDFWRRWHISLSTWLRDYLFMPMSLGMRRIGKTGAFLAMFITFAVCGIWHGPSWNFLIWGSIQGLFLGIELLFLAKILARLKIFAIFYTMMVVMTGFVFVMTPDLNTALQYIESMFSLNKISPFSPAELLSADQSLIMMIAALLCIPFRFSYNSKSQVLLKIAGLAYIVFLLVIFILSVMALTSETHNPFIYFRF